MYSQDSQANMTMNFRVYSAHAGNTVTLDKDEIYYGVSDLFNILKTIKTAITNQDYTTFKNTVKTNMDKLGIVTGDSIGNFNPNANITRQDMAVMLYRLIGNNQSSGDISVFTDSSSVSDYAVSAVAHLSGTGVVKGMGDGTFSPHSPATRAQAAQMIYGILDMIL